MTPYRGPFGREEAAHLLRRAAFAPRPGEVDRAVAEGLERTLDGLFDADVAPTPDELAAELSLRQSDDRETIAGSWLARLGRTTTPLRENLALFWHNHFVSALSKARSGRMMLDQIDLFRRFGAGSFLELTLAVSRDPAMVRYLDSERSTKAQPNENFARELLELFTTGAGPYSERDVKEGARAFTGYHLRGERFEFSAASHDAGEKTFLGVAGPHAGEDVIRIAVERPETAVFLGAKLARHFVADAPDRAVTDELAAAWRARGGRTGLVLRDLFSSEAFFAPENRLAVTRSPAALLAAVLRTTGVLAPARDLARAAQMMGQTLVDPPTVKGYAGGAAWLNPATRLARLAAMASAAEKAEAQAKLSSSERFSTRDGLRAFAVDILGRAPSDATLDRVDSAAPAGAAHRAATVLGLLLCHPDFQRS